MMINNKNTNNVRLFMAAMTFYLKSCFFFNHSFRLVKIKCIDIYIYLYIHMYIYIHVDKPLLGSLQFCLGQFH